MSDLKRYQPSELLGMVPDDRGMYVKHQDVEHLLTRVAELEAECQWLRDDRDSLLLFGPEPELRP